MFVFCLCLSGLVQAADTPEDIFWRSVSKSNLAEEYRLYADQYPKGKHVTEAKRRIGLLDSPAETKNDADTELSFLGIAGRPPKGSFQNAQQAVDWLSAMSSRLEVPIKNSKSRLEFLRGVHYEATRAGLDPQLVLALIDTVSAFNKYAVTANVAKGFMSVRPEWVGIIGRPTDDLFHLRTNLRYGCTILRHYIDLEDGDLFRALARYELTIEHGPGKDIEGDISPLFSIEVLARLHDNWSYKDGSIHGK